jgi:hypothetical protein
LIFTEEEMRVHANDRAAERAAAQRRKSMRRPVPHHVGVGWQAPQR